MNFIYNIFKINQLKVLILNLNFNALRYMVLNFGARVFIAVTQLYAISIFTKVHDTATTSVLILLFGYIIWFQLFEFGLTQTIQNKLNRRKIKIKNITIIILFQYIIALLIGLLALKFDIFSFLLLNNIEHSYSIENKKIFDIGCAILLLSSNNILIHRFLILYRKSYLSNFLLFLQAFITCSSLFFYKMNFNSEQIVSVMVYFFPQLLVTFPILVKLIIRLFYLRKSKNIPTDMISTLKYSSSFMLISFLSSFLLGLDYLILSYFSNSKELLSYHITIRFFYFSFMMYFAYITFAAKKLGNRSEVYNTNKIKNYSIFIGLTSTILVYFLVLALNSLDVLNMITNGIKIDQKILFTAFIYFIIRVFADTRLVIAHNLSYRINLIKLYSVQILTSLIFMPLLGYYLGGVGVLLSLSLSYLSGLIIKLEMK